MLMTKLGNRLFHLNIHNFLSFLYFYLKVQLDTLETMLFEINIYVTVDFPEKVFIWVYECLFFWKKKKKKK